MASSSTRGGGDYGQIFVLVMGVSGSEGKTTIGIGLAKALGLKFLDADQLHSPGNIGKMKAGIPLNDEDRLEWLQTISQRMDEALTNDESGHPGGGLVLGCSALKIKYRRILRGFSVNYNASSKPCDDSPATHRHLHILYLKGTFEELSVRVQKRTGHFMPPSLLQSQFDALEEPTAEEQVDDDGKIRGKLLTIPMNLDPDEIISRFIDGILCKDNE